MYKIFIQENLVTFVFKMLQIIHTNGGSSWINLDKHFQNVADEVT